jgi:hypothetical protein
MALPCAESTSYISGPYLRIQELLMCTSLVPRESRHLVYAQLAADAELLDEIKVCLAVLSSDILQQALALADEL